MVGKNNTQERFRRNATKDKRYTLKKLSVGLASVALGTVLFLNGAETVSAEAEVVDPNTPAAQPVQETFQFNYLNQATGARLDGFFGDYANANEAEKAFRHYANGQGYTLLNVRLEGHTFTADVAVEQDVQPEVEQEAQPAESTFQFIYRNKETGEKFDSFFGDYVNENEAEKDFRHYANQHGYTLLNVRLEGHTFTANVAVEQEVQPAESAFQFIYRDKETGEKFDSFFGDYANENEAEKDFRHYANQHGYTLLNVRQNGHTFTADVARDSQSEETPEVEKGYSYALNFDGRTESANLGEFDSEEQAELALRIFANEKGYELSNLRLEGRTFHADAKVATESDEPSESTDRYLQEAKDRARGIINGLENLFDTQKPSYLERIEDADSVAAVEAIVEEAQNYVNEGKGGENGQAPEQPENPEYNQKENLVTYDLQITDQNGRTQTQRVTFPSRELALNYISQLVRSYEKAGVVLNEERSDVEGKDNTFILVFEEKQAEEPAKADYTVKVIIDGEERQSQALPDTTRQGAIDYAERLANSYEQDGFTYNHLDAGLPSDTVIRIELSSPELDVPSHTEDAPAPEALDVTKAEALDIIDGLDLDDLLKDILVNDVNEAETEEQVNNAIRKGYELVAAGLAEEPSELDVPGYVEDAPAPESLDKAKAEALEAIERLEYLSDEDKEGFVDRINDADDEAEVNRLVGVAHKQNINNLPKPLDVPGYVEDAPAPEALDKAKAEALEAIERLEYLSDEDKEGFVDRINDADDEAEVNRLVGVAHKQNINNLPKPLDVPGYVEDAPAPESLDKAKAEALEAIERLEYLSDEDKEGFVDRINDADDEAEVNRLVGVAHKQNINNLPKPLDVPGYVEDAPAPEVLDEAKTEALDQIAELDYFTEEEKQDLIDRINEYDNLGDVDFIVSKAIEENDRRHLEKEAEFDLDAYKKLVKDELKAKGFDNDFVFGLIDKANTKEGVDALVEELNAKPEAEFDLDAYKKLVKDELKAKGFDNDFVFGLIDKANTKEGVDALVEELNAKPEAEFDLGAYKELVKNELKAKGFDNDFVFGLIDKANTKEGVDALVEELNAKPEAEFDLGAYKELVKNELKAKGFDNDFVFGLIDKANTKEGVDALVEELNAKPEAEFDLGAYKELVKNELKAKGFDNDFVFGLIDKANTKEGVDALVEELNAKPEAEFDLGAYKKLVKDELKAKGFDNDFVFGLIDKANTKEGVDALVEELNAKPEAEFDLDAYKKLVKDELKAKGFDNDFVFGLIDKATSKEGVDALVANIDLDELNKLNEEFGQLEQKAEELNKELEALINKVEGKEEVAQEDLDAILNKVNEIRENLDKMQKHINILPSDEREKQQAELNEVKGLLDKVEEQYSYSFDLDAYKEEVKDGLKAQGFDNEFVFGLIDKAANKEGVDALVANIDLDELNKLNEEFGQLEQKAEELNKELEALINEVEGKDEVAQEDLDAILNKVNEIRENLDKMQKHINILPSDEREKQQAELNEVKGLLDKVEEQYSYSFDLDGYKEEVKDSLKAQGFDNKLVLGLIDKANTKEGVDALVANIDLDAFNKLGEDFSELEKKAEELNDELVDLINEVEEKEEVAQEDLDAILNKVNEIRENLDKMQKHINILPSDERENAQAELGRVKELLAAVEDQYSYFDLDAYKEEVKDSLKAQGFDNKLVLGLIDKANTKEGVDALVADIDLDAFNKLGEDFSELEKKAEELNDELVDLINEVEGKEEVAQEDLDAILNKVNEIRENLDKMQKHVNTLPSEDRKNAQAELDQVKELLDKVEEQYSYSFDLDGYKEEVKDSLKAQGFDNKLVLGLIDKANTKEGVDALVADIDLDAFNKLGEDFSELEKKAEELNDELVDLINEVEGKEEVAQEDLDAILNKVNEIRENLDKMQKHVNTLPSEDRKNAQAELDQVKELLDKVEEQYSYSFDLDGYKEEVKDSLKAQGFDNKLVLGLIDKANTKEGVDALVADIDLDAFNKLGEDFSELEKKAEELNDELVDLINEVEGKEEVAHEDLDAILNKVNEIRENLDKMQKHVNTLPSEDRKNAQAELDQVKELLAAVEDQYSYESPLQELKNEVISDLLTKGASTELLNEIQNAPSAQVVRQLAGEFERQKEISERTSSLKTTIKTEVTHDGQKSKLLEELKEAKTLPQLEELESKVDRQIAVDQKRAEVVEIKNKWEKLYSELEEDSEGNKFTTEAQYSEFLNLSSQYNQLLPEWEKLAQGDYTNESAVQVFKDIVKDTFDKVPPVINIGELGDSVELKIKELVSDSTKKEEFENKLTSANTVKELQELEKEVDDFLDEQDKAELEREKNKALKEIDQLINDQLVAEHQVQQQKDRVNNKESIVEDILEAVTEARQIAFNNYKTGTVENVEEDKELSQALKDKYVPLLKAAETGSELDKVLSLLDVEEFVEKAEKALEEALEKAQKEGEFTVHDQSLVEAANDKVETDKANAQTLLDELSKQYAEELTGNEGLKSRVDDLQSRLNKVNKVKVPDVSEEILNEFKNEAKKALKNLASNLTDKERKVYEDIIDKMDAKDDAGNNVDEIIQVAIAEDQYKQIEAENDPAEKEKLKKRAQGALNFVEETSKDGEDHPDYKQDLLKEKKRVQDLLNGETTPTPPTDPTDDTEEQPGSPDPDTDSEQGTGDQTPDEDNGQAGTDPSDENDTPVDEPSENPQLKAKKASTNEALGELSNLTEENKGKYKNEIENATDENTVDYILDKAKLDDIKNLITASKKDKDAEGRKEVTVKAQKDAKKTINDIKEKLKKNNLTEEQKANLRKLLQNVEVPRTHHYMPQIGNATKEFLSTGILSGKASHARVGWQADGQDNGNGTVWNKTVNFSSGDDILEVRNGIRENAKINLGKGDDQLIVHGVAPASGKNVFRRASGGAVDGGEGTDTVILKGNSEQYLHGVHIPNFDRVELNGTDGHFQIKLSEMKDQKLGGNKPLIVNGVAGQGNTVDFDHKASNRKYENKPGQTIGNWTAQPKTQTKDGKTYVVWQHKDALASSAHEVWVENTLGVRG